MRIVIPTLHYYPDRPSGSSRLAYDEALYLAAQGHDVWVVTQDLTRTKPEYEEDAGLHVLRYPAVQLSALDPRRARIHQQQTARLLARYVPVADVVHGHALLQHAGALDHYGDRVRACYSVHSPVRPEMEAASRGASVDRRALLMLSGRLMHQIERRCLTASDGLQCESNYTRDMLRRLHTPAIAERTQVIPGWVDLEQFRVAPDRDALKRQLGWPLDVPVLYTLRRLVPRMGLDRLVRACAMLREAGFRFHMVIGGAGPMRASLDALIGDLGVSDCVRTIGFVPQEALPDTYAAADAFVLPTTALECFGIIALEALASGRPVLATPVAAIPEILNQVEPQWLADSESTESLFRLLSRFLAGELPAHAPEDLRAFVAARYSLGDVLQRLTAFVLGSGASHAERGGPR